MAEERNLRKVRQGIVVSDKMDKTVVVAVERKVPHKLYKKALKSTTKFKAHDENNECRIGDTILVRTTRITDLSPAKIKHIATTFLTLEFDDPLIGFAPINIRTNEILECKSYA